jgi:hypothetical protein
VVILVDSSQISTLSYEQCLCLLLCGQIRKYQNTDSKGKAEKSVAAWPCSTAEHNIQTCFQLTALQTQKLVCKQVGEPTYNHPLKEEGTA